MKHIIFYTILAFLAACGDPVTQADSTPEEVSSDLASLFAAIDQLDTGRISMIQVTTPIKCTGKIDVPPTDIFSIHARMGGYIKKLYHLEGDRVRQGEVLATLEDPRYIARQRELLELKSRVDLARQNLDRQETLDEQGATTSKQLQSARAEWSELSASYNGLISELEMTGFSTQDLIDNGKYQSTLSLTAPTAAIVNKVNANTGQYVEPHDVIYQLTGLDHIHLELNVLERDLPFMTIGDSVIFNIAGYQRDFHAEIVKIGAEVDEETGALMAHCHIDDDEHPDTFRPGIFASATIIPEAQTGYVLPIEGALKQGAHYFGYVVENNELVRVPLKDAHALDGQVRFSADESDLQKTWVTNGAYYIDQ